MESTATFLLILYRDQNLNWYDWPAGIPELLCWLYQIEQSFTKTKRA